KLPRRRESKSEEVCESKISPLGRALWEEDMEVTPDDVLPEVNAAAVTENFDRNELVESSNAVVLADGVVAAVDRKIEAEDRGEREIESETPPEDDVCPICFGSFTVPCRGNCGHWYCDFLLSYFIYIEVSSLFPFGILLIARGRLVERSCILQYWNYAAISRPCKCPMCLRHITKLSPEATLQERQEQEVKEVLDKIRRYNRLFVGGLTGFVQKLHELPFLMKRMVWHMMDTDVNNLYFHEMFMSTIYTAAEFNFIPTGGFRIVTVFDYAAIAMILILRLVGIYRRRRLAQQIRHLAAAVIQEPEREQRE
ncbi:hypothetical protein CARUB_v10007238mg, partial [Capsella rubella]